MAERRGLFLVSDDAIAVFVAIEQVVKQCFHKYEATNFGSRSELCATIVRNEDVQFYWCIVTADMKKMQPLRCR